MFIQCREEPRHAWIVIPFGGWRGKIKDVATARDTLCRQRHVIKLALPRSDPGRLQLRGTGNAAHHAGDRVSGSLQTLCHTLPDIATADD